VVEEIEQNVARYALINNAGYGPRGTLEENSMDELRQQFEVNVFVRSHDESGLASYACRREGRVLNVTRWEADDDARALLLPEASLHSKGFVVVAKEVRPPVSMLRLSSRAF